MRKIGKNKLKWKKFHRIKKFTRKLKSSWICRIKIIQSNNLKISRMKNPLISSLFYLKNDENSVYKMKKKLKVLNQKPILFPHQYHFSLHLLPRIPFWEFKSKKLCFKTRESLPLSPHNNFYPYNCFWISNFQVESSHHPPHFTKEK